MPSTYTLISANTLSATTNTVTFSAIPSTFTDLVLRYSIRSNGTEISNIRINGSTSSVYSRTRLQGNGSTASSNRDSSQTSINLNNSTTYDGGFTSDTFSSGEIYIPSYGATQNKPISISNVEENNATYATAQAFAGLFSDTTAITSLTILNGTSTDQFVIGSSFYLYGIKNS
jgi:hypothetical protein